MTFKKEYFLELRPSRYQYHGDIIPIAKILKALSVLYQNNIEKSINKKTGF